MADLKYWVWYSISAGTHRAAAARLFEIAGKDPEQIYKMSREQLVKYGVTDEELLRALSSKDLSAAEKEMRIAEKFNIKLLCPEDEEYPADLLNINDNPYVLYIRGTSDETTEDKLRIAIIGSRRASSYGLGVAYDLAYALAKRGVVVVSGMATGIDAQAHKGAIEAGGKTIGVLGCGVNVVYPQDNSQLMVDIMKNGEVMSEFPFDTPPYKWNFPQRNRIISGLCHGVVVVEAEEISGTTITANLALEQGRELFAVPGNINSPASVGTNRLIKEGAVPVTCVNDILGQFPDFDFDEEAPVEEKQVMENLTENKEETEEIMPEQVILEAIRLEALSADEISEKTGLAVSQVSSIMTIMEISGLVEAMPGRKYIKTSKLR